MAKKLSPVEAEKLRKIMADPVTWARSFLISNNAATKKYGPWVARDYQEEMLRDPSTRKVYRCGRRCLPGNVTIFDPSTGKLETVKDLYDKKTATVAAMDENDYTIKTMSDCPVSYNGKKEVYRLILEMGKTIDATGNHPFFTVNGWKELKDLTEEDYIAVPAKLNFWGNEEIDDNDVKLLAYIIGDGNCTTSTIRFAQTPETKQTEEMSEIVKEYGCILHHYEKDPNPCNFNIIKIKDKHNRTIPNGVKKVLEKYGVYGHGADTKTIPDKIMMAPKKQVSLFLSRLFSTDGWASIHRANNRNTSLTEIGYCSNSEIMIRQIAHLLLRYGIQSSVSKKGKAWNVLISDKYSIITFAEEIGIFGKEEAVQRCVDEANLKNDVDDFMPFEINGEIEDKINELGIKKSELVALWESNHKQQQRLKLNKYKLQKWKAKLIADHLHMEDLSKFCSGEILWLKVKTIKSMGMMDTYDLHVPKYHNFVANDIISHNTGKSEVMVVEGLHKAFTHKGFRILYVTPYENQVNLLFMRMKELIHDSPLLKNEVVKMKNSPYTIEFKNGSVIMGFTTGASSGSGAASVRGQRADWLFLDEIDYMGNEDYSTVAMIAGERSDIGMTCSSTPTGARRTFYSMCTDPSWGYSQHFHPSTHNPNWCQEMEDQFRAQLTPSQYEHEILAEFGTEESGVFPKNKVDAARNFEYYAYTELTDLQVRNLDGQPLPHMLLYDDNNHAPSNPFRCVGVDFDQFQAGSSIVVLDFDINLKKFKVIKRIEVPRAEYSLDNAVNWIIRVNNIYNPSWIFCDRGYGDYQIERLHIYGDEHPLSGLKNKVIGYQFKESLDIIDPITREHKKEPLKQFMVNQLILSFERDRIALSPFDEILHKQLIDYSVDHIGADGKPIYTSINEHFVDALGLAHLAFVLKFPNLTSAIKMPENTSIIEHSNVLLGMKHANRDLRDITSSVNPWNSLSNNRLKQIGKDPGEREGDYQKWVKVPMGGKSSGGRNSFWGKRGGNSSFGRSMW